MNGPSDFSSRDDALEPLRPGVNLTVQQGERHRPQVHVADFLRRHVKARCHLAELWPGWAHWLNAATWMEAPRFVVGHPDDGELMEELAHVNDVAPRLERFEPYRDRRMQGFFSDFQ
jgi:hypothetical protein